MNDKDFKALQQSIKQKMIELSCLQDLYAKETGSIHIHSLDLKQDEKATEALIYKAEIDRKNKLLKDALVWLTALEWEASLSVIADIEKELEAEAKNLDKSEMV